MEETTRKVLVKGTQTLARGFDCLRLVAGGVTGVKELAERLGLPRTTAHRMLAGLVSGGYLYHVPGGGYLLGHELIYLGSCALEQRPLVTIAKPFLQHLSEETRDTVHLGTPDGPDVFYLDKIAGTRGLEMASRIGQRMPMASTGLGKAIMQTLPEEMWPELHQAAIAMQKAHPQRIAPRPIAEFARDLRLARERGYSFDMEENEVGIRCVGAPLFDVCNKVIGSISVASAVPFMPEERMTELALEVCTTAREISHALGWKGPSRWGCLVRMGNLTEA